MEVSILQVYARLAAEFKKLSVFQPDRGSSYR